LKIGRIIAADFNIAVTNRNPGFFGTIRIAGSDDKQNRTYRYNVSEIAFHQFWVLKVLKVNLVIIFSLQA